MSIPLKILVLDDDDGRHEVFRKRFKDHIVTHVRTYGEACKALSETVFDLAQLDHDLNDFPQQYQSLNPNRWGDTEEGMDGVREKYEYTGYDVAKFIAALPEERRPRRVIIHSWNPAGARCMHEALWHAGMRKVHLEAFNPER